MKEEGYLWVKIDVRLANHWKADEAGPVAMWAYIQGLCHAKLHDTDGLLRAATVAAIDRSLSHLLDGPLPSKLLMSVGLWHTLGNGDVEINDYRKYQETKEDREHRRVAGAEAANKRWAAHREANGSPIQRQRQRQSKRRDRVNTNTGEREGASAPRHPAQKAKPGNQDEVRSYWQEVGLLGDYREFWDYFETNGWVQGKGKAIKDWRAAARGWSRREAIFRPESVPRRVIAPAPEMTEAEKQFLKETAHLERRIPEGLISPAAKIETAPLSGDRQGRGRESN